ncbi:hypothetical protein KAH94_03530 [bacterium]|nr:hypothetical protein [bacterium]
MTKKLILTIVISLLTLKTLQTNAMKIHEWSAVNNQKWITMIGKTIIKFNKKNNIEPYFLCKELASPIVLSLSSSDQVNSANFHHQNIFNMYIKKPINFAMNLSLKLSESPRLSKFPDTPCCKKLQKIKDKFDFTDCVFQIKNLTNLKGKKNLKELKNILLEYKNKTTSKLELNTELKKENKTLYAKNTIFKKTIETIVKENKKLKLLLNKKNN